MATLLTVAGPVLSASSSLVYSDAALRNDQERLTRRANQLFESGLIDFLSVEEKSALRGVELDLPLARMNPLWAKAGTFGGVPTMIIPLSTLRFIEDLSLAYAWRYVNNYSLEPMDEYMALLRYRKTSEFPNGVRPTPLAAMGVPPNVWQQDKRVDELSLRFRNTAWAFVLAHELGHLRYKHSTKEKTPAQIQKQEEVADEFAAELLSRTDTIPMGAILWFQASAVFLKNRNDFDSDAEYLGALDSELTHPVTAERLRKLAGIMHQQAMRTADPNQADVLSYISGRLSGIGEILADPEMQQFIKRCAMKRSMEDLQRKRDLTC